MTSLSGKVVLVDLTNDKDNVDEKVASDIKNNSSVVRKREELVGTSPTSKKSKPAPKSPKSEETDEEELEESDYESSCDGEMYHPGELDSLASDGWDDWDEGAHGFTEHQLQSKGISGFL